MRVYKRVRRVNGKRREAGSYTIDFRLPNGAPATIPGLTDKDKTEAFGRKLDRLVACKSCHEALDRDLVEWIEQIPEETRARLADAGLLDAARAAAGKELLEQIEDFRAALIAKGTTEKHANLTANRAKTVIRRCAFGVYSDITPSKVLEHLAILRGPHSENGKARKEISFQTSNFYLQSIKAFTRWCVRERRASENPIAHLKGLNVRLDRKHDRRALTVDESRRLLEAARNGKRDFCMTGTEREMLYRIAMETGLRWGELRSLTCASFHLDTDPPVVTVEASYSKHRREDTQPLRRDTADLLRTHFALKLDGAKAFPMPAREGAGAMMIRADLAVARAAWLKEAEGNRVEHKARNESYTLQDTDALGRVVDFHALRHTFITNLCNGGVHPKTAQALARHSTIGLTMDCYTHLTATNAAGALDVLPDLCATPVATEVRKTGTDDVQPMPMPAGPRKALLPLTVNLTGSDAQTCILRHNMAQYPSKESDRPKTRKGLKAQGNPKDSDDDDERGGLAEWTKAAVLKTAVPQGTGGSNPSPSAGCFVLCGRRGGVKRGGLIRGGGDV